MILDRLGGHVLSYFRRRTLTVLRKAAEWRANALLQRQPELWRTLQGYLRRSESTGCSPADYWQLYRLIRERKPVEVLECGTGVSTLVIAHALLENGREGGARGRVTSMEEEDHYLQMARELLPEPYRPYVHFVHSPTVEDYFSAFRGVRYRDVPERHYDFVFVDGPSYRSPMDGTPTFDFDFLHVLRKSEGPVAGLVDKRVSTCFVLQQVLGIEKVRYSAVLGLGFIHPCTRKDLGQLPETLSSMNFEKSFRAIGATRLTMHPPSTGR